MLKTVFITGVVALAVLPNLAIGQTKSGSAAAFARVPHCVISLIDEAQVPAREAGELLGLDVREGAKVQAGQLLARIDDEVSRARREIAELEFQAAEAQATNEVRIEAAIAGADVAEAEFQQSLATNKRNPGSVSVSQLRKEQLAAKHAKLQIKLAEHEVAVAVLTSKGKGAQVKASDIDISRRQILAPIDGVVAQLSKHKGEWVNPGDALLRIVRMDKLRIEGFLNADEFSPIDVADRPVSVEVKLTRGRVEKFTTKIEFVSPLVEASGEYRVWAEIDNRQERDHWILRPGMTAEMTITVDVTPAPGSAAKGKTTSK